MTQPHRFWHRLRDNKTAQLPTCFCAVDTETQFQPRTGLDGKHVLLFGCAVYWDSPRGKKKIPHREGLIFETPDQFWDWLEQHVKPKSRLILTAHNLAFDFLVLDGIRQLKRRGWDLPLPITSGLKFISKARKAGRTLYLLDTLNFIPTSLQELGRGLGLKKYPMPPANAPREKWIAYCQADLDIVELFWRRLIDFLRQEDLGSFAPTAGSLAFKIFRHKFLKHKIVIHADPAACRLERKAYHGGRCECYRIGQLPKRDYYFVDVNSMYPAVMAENDYPVLLLERGNAISFEKIEDKAIDHFAIARVGINTPEPLFPVTWHQKVIYPIGQFETTLAEPELQRAFSLGLVEYIAEYAIYDQAPIFQAYVDTLYRMRTDFRNRDLSAFSLFCKMLLNALYGRFGMRGHVREDLGYNPSIRFGYGQAYSTRMRSEYNVTYWNGRGYCDHQEGESFESFPAISAAVTSYARCYLWDLMERAGRDHVFYCDTDSLIVDQIGLDHLAGDLDDQQLGKLKIERRSKYVTLRGIKDYSFSNAHKRKGIKRDAQRIAAKTYQQTRFGSLLENVRAGNVSGVLVRQENKELKAHYDRGMVDHLGFVAPLVLADF